MSRFPVACPTEREAEASLAMTDGELVEKKEEVSEVREHLALSCLARIQGDRFGLGSE
jgi:hypothetical protein